MRDCVDYRENILLHLDKELCVSQADELRTHLELCENCRETLEAEKELSRVLRRSRPLYSAPASLRDRLLRAMNEPDSGSLPRK
ncbi:mycothiol system anti-sigma-R factor [Silvibacterium bohemicum]|uniref:Mycothiol system anti-sigma-R factor n=1 Tax=Silvibacterium bohemicum TaxID=1577686 RepID=A0A841K3E5_9BACT|nr:mycothiol system anti-sigma-R factor [Silvibacterium bohemicum]